MSIHQEILYETSAQEVFSALTNAKQFSAVTGVAAEINLQSGGAFSCFGGMITGFTLELKSNQRIIQAWRATNWEEGVYSIIKIELQETSNGQCKLVFDHTGFPEEHKSHLEQGWYERYWEPLREYLTR